MLTTPKLRGASSGGGVSLGKKFAGQLASLLKRRRCARGASIWSDVVVGGRWLIQHVVVAIHSSSAILAWAVAVYCCLIHKASTTSLRLGTIQAEQPISLAPMERIPLAYLTLRYAVCRFGARAQKLSPSEICCLPASAPSFHALPYYHKLPEILPDKRLLFSSVCFAFSVRISSVIQNDSSSNPSCVQGVARLSHTPDALCVPSRSTIPEICVDHRQGPTDG